MSTAKGEVFTLFEVYTLRTYKILYWRHISSLFFSSIQYLGFREERINSKGDACSLGRWFDYMIIFVIPVEFICVLGWWFWQSATVLDPQGWWNPFHTTSIGTCIFQWGTAIVVLLLLNRFLWKKMLDP